MTRPTSTHELAAQIEQAIDSYLTEIRRATQEAVSRAFARPPSPSRARPGRARPKPESVPRRSPEELGDVQSRLLALVHEAPGESMVALASRLAVPLRTLQRPMERLRQEGRVRSVGERSRMRYFPVPARAASGA